MYVVRVGFGPGDWDRHSEWSDKGKADEVARDLRNTVDLSFRYGKRRDGSPFYAPISVKKVPDRLARDMQRPKAVVVAASVLRKRSRL